jgi:Na+/melibiose symporter-like transporter
MWEAVTIEVSVASIYIIFSILLLFAAKMIHERKNKNTENKTQKQNLRIIKPENMQPRKLFDSPETSTDIQETGIVTGSSNTNSILSGKTGKTKKNLKVGDEVDIYLGPGAGKKWVPLLKTKVTPKNKRWITLLLKLLKVRDLILHGVIAKSVSFIIKAIKRGFLWLIKRRYSKSKASESLFENALNTNGESTDSGTSESSSPIDELNEVVKSILGRLVNKQITDGGMNGGNKR